MDTLYEISTAYLNFLEAVDNGDIPEEAIADTLAGLEGALEDKADNIACLIKSLKAQVAGIKAEEENLAERRRAKEGRIVWLTDYLGRELLSAGMDIVETNRNKITFRNSTAVDIYDIESFVKNASSDYLTYKDPTPDKKAITQAIKDGKEVPGCGLVTKRNIQIK